MVARLVRCDDRNDESVASNAFVGQCLLLESCLAPNDPEDAVHRAGVEEHSAGRRNHLDVKPAPVDDRLVRESHRTGLNRLGMKTVEVNPEAVLAAWPEWT